MPERTCSQYRNLLRGHAQKQLNRAFEVWSKGRSFEDCCDSDTLSRPLNELVVDQVLALQSSMGPSALELQLVARLHEQNVEAVSQMQGRQWHEVKERRPHLVSAYLSFAWIPALCAVDRHVDAMGVATAFLMQLRGRGMSRIYGAGGGSFGPSNSPRSMRLLVMSIVFQSLTIHLPPGSSELRAGAWHLLETFFTYEDISPCAAVWAPAVGYMVGIDVPREWLVRELNGHPNLAVPYHYLAKDIGEWNQPDVQSAETESAISARKAAEAHSRAVQAEIDVRKQAEQEAARRGGVLPAAGREASAKIISS